METATVTQTTITLAMTMPMVLGVVMVLVKVVVMGEVILAAFSLCRSHNCMSDGWTALLTALLPDMQKKAKVGVALWAGLIPDNAHDPALLQSLLDHGAAGFKSFMSPAG